MSHTYVTLNKRGGQMNEPEQERTQPSPTGGPPSMEQVLNLPERVEDALYDRLGDLFCGPRGTWHRLWACLMTHWTFENDPLLGTVYVVPELRNELDQQ